jgi:hypothetical protein
LDFDAILAGAFGGAVVKAVATLYSRNSSETTKQGCTLELSEPIHSAYLEVSKYHLEKLLDLAGNQTFEAIELPNGNLRVEAIRLAEFLSGYRPDRQFVELSGESFAAMEKALKDKGYPPDIGDWNITPDQ